MLFAPAIFRLKMQPCFKVEFTTMAARCNMVLRMGGTLWRFAVCLLTLSCFAALGAGTQEGKDLDRVGTPVPKPEKAFAEAEENYYKNPMDERPTWEYGRACFDMADVATSREERARYAELGITATRKASLTYTNSAPVFYYLALNYGQLARSKGIAALRLLRPMKQALEKARILDPSFDFGGPDRGLGLLYRDAPGWTVGDRKLARECLLRTVKFAPAYPDNHLELIASYLEWGERDLAREQMSQLEKILPQARNELAGPQWEQAWEAWEERLKELKTKLGQS